MLSFSYLSDLPANDGQLPHPVSDTETMEKAVGTEAEKVSEAPDATASDEPTVTEMWEDTRLRLTARTEIQSLTTQPMVSVKLSI